MFAPERLEKRFDLFEKLPLTSLGAQTDKNFQLHILTAEAMPRPYRGRLRELAKSMLSPEQIRLFPRPPGSAGKILCRAAIKSAPETGPLVQVVLDDDDALATDFVATLRQDCERIAADFKTSDDYHFLSYPIGASIVVENDTTALFARNVPFTNLGLALITARETQRSPFATAHKQIGQRHPSSVIETNRPMYLRAVHDLNDSRAIYDTEAPFSAHQIAEFLPRFPSLRHFSGTLLAPEKIASVAERRF